MKWILVILVALALACGDNDTRRERPDCDYEAALEEADALTDEYNANPDTRGAGGSTPGVRREQLCRETAHPDQVDEWCWWKVDQGIFNERSCSYGVACVTIPVHDVDRLRAERCN